MSSPVVEFFDKGVAQLIARWTKDDIESIGDRNAPAEMLGRADWLLKGDMNALWGRWIADGICDPQNYPRNGDFANFAADLRDALSALYAMRKPSDEIDDLAEELADVLWKRVEQTRLVSRRGWTRREREEAWDLAQPEPRCWVCGYRFERGAIQKFRREPVTDPIALPQFVDAIAPRGLKQWQLGIEIDHVVALASGGDYLEENLRLACGWCNRYKSSKQVLYDASIDVKQLRFADGTRRRIPPPFWVVRLLAVRGRCEALEGCTARAANAQLTVAPLMAAGAPTPTNLWVTCKRHDPLRATRLVERSTLV